MQIKSIKSIFGTLLGTNMFKKLSLWFLKPKITIEIKIDILNDKVIIRWPVIVNPYGKRPKKLEINIKLNKLIIKLKNIKEFFIPICWSNSDKTKL